MFDFVGVLILMVVIVLFGFLTTRVWRLRNAFLKWGGVIVTGLPTLLSTVILVLALIGFSKLNEQHDNPVANIRPRRAAGPRLRQLPFS